MRLFCAVFVAFALFAPAAQAGAPDAWQRRALEVTQRVWHPACGTITIEWQDPALAGGTVEWGGWAYLGECRIYEPTTRVWLGYPDFCTAVLHEGGHAAGYGHSARGIMAPDRMVARNEARRDGKFLLLWSGVDRRCLRKTDHAARF